jgi:hypothetical protein
MGSRSQEERLSANSAVRARVIGFFSMGDSTIVAWAKGDLIPERALATESTR